MAVYLRGSCEQKHKHSGACRRWYYKFTIRGVTYKRSIPEALTKRQAEQVEGQARQAVFDGKYGRQSGAESFTKFVREVYLPWAKENKRSWYHDSRYCEVICAYFNNRTFGDITPMLVEHFKKHRREGITQRGTSRNMATVNRELAQLSKIFSLAVDNGYCETNPCRRVRRFRVDNRRERVLSADEEVALLEVLAGAHSPLRAVALLALNTGLRRGEMMGLRWDDVDLAGLVINLPGAIAKSGRPRSVPANDAALDALRELKERGRAGPRSRRSRLRQPEHSQPEVRGGDRRRGRHGRHAPHPQTHLRHAAEGRGRWPVHGARPARSRFPPDDRTLHARDRGDDAARRRVTEPYRAGECQNRTNPPARERVTGP